MQRWGTLSPVTFRERYETHSQLWCDGPHEGLIAFDRVMRRHVILNSPYGPEAYDRFVEVAQVRSQLRHTNLIPIYDFGVTPEGRPYFTEPFFQTIRLDNLCSAEKGQNVEGILWRQLRFFLQACSALALVHANSFLHLQLEPRNILITQPSEEVFLVRGNPSLQPAELHADNLSGIKTIVPGYMAPEEIPARPGPLTEATDVYGLGGILFYMLYGEPPNQGVELPEIDELLLKRQGSPPPGNLQFADSHSISLAKELEATCLHALESDPTKRQQKVEEFSNEIESILMCAAG